jgi:hypothetical protein
LMVTGSVSLNAPVALSIALAAGMANDTLITIIDNNGTDAVNVANADSRFVHDSVVLEEGSIFFVTGGFGTQQFQITYAGGTGNDVVLVAVPEPSFATFLAGSLGILLGLRRTRSNPVCS